MFGQPAAIAVRVPQWFAAGSRRYPCTGTLGELRSRGGIRVVRGYAVHLLFHLLAIAAGAACGIAGGLWWFGGDPNALWLAIGALVVGVIVLILQSLYISADQPPARPAAQPAARPTGPPTPPPQSRPSMQLPPQRRERTRPDLEPVATPPQDTKLQPSMDISKAVDQETKASAAEALKEQWSTNPPTRKS
jgi:hypothetical protein